MNVFWTCITDTWTPTIGDPDLLGWATTLLYLAAAYLSFRCVRTARLSSSERRFERYFWASTAVLLALLAVNKQLDLQTFVTSAGRCVAQGQGWYGLRRGVQLAFALVIAGMLGFWVVWILIGLRHAMSRMWLELLGIIAVFAFVLLRVLRFLHVYHTHLLGNNAWVERIFELTGPIILIVAAQRFLGRHRKP